MTIDGAASYPVLSGRPWKDSHVLGFSFAAAAAIVIVKAADETGVLQSIPRVILWIVILACVPGSIARVFTRRHLLQSLLGALLLALLSVNTASLIISDDVLYGYFRDALSSMPQNLFRRILVFVSSFFLLKMTAAAFETVILYRRAALSDSKMRSASTPGQVFAAATLLTGFLLCGLWLTRYYPSGTSPDTMNQWKQIHGSIPLTDLHTPFHTLLMKLLLQVWDSYSTVIFFQIVAVSLVSGFLYSRMYQRGIRLSIIMLASITSSSALWCAIYMYPWKDTLYAVMIAAVFLAIVREEGRDFDMPLWRAGMIGLMLALVLLLRYNGIVCVLLAGGYFCVALVRRKRFRQAAALALACLLAVMGSNALMYGLLGVRRQANGFSAQVFGAGIAAVSAQGRDIREEELRQIDEILGIDWIQSQYEPWKASQLIWVRETDDPEGFFRRAENAALNNSFVLGLGEHRGEIIRLYLSLLLRNPLICLREIAYSTWIIWGNYGAFSNISLLVLIMLAAGFAFRASQRKAVFSALLPLLANSLSIAVSTITNESRYLLPNFLLFAPIILYLLSLESGEA